jgi:hypothetical protein
MKLSWSMDEKQTKMLARLIDGESILFNVNTDDNSAEIQLGGGIKLQLGTAK